MQPDSSVTQEGENAWLALYRSVAALSGTLDPQRVLETALNVSESVIASLGGQPERLVRAVLLFPGDQIQSRKLQVSAMRGLSPEDCAIELSATSGLIGQVLQDGEARLTQTVDDDPELVKFARLRSCKELYCIPLGKPIPEGILLYGHPDTDFFTADRRNFLYLLAGQTWTALSNARRFRESQLKIERILDLQELNRVELGRELHDGPIQSVAALAMRVNIARRLAAREAPGLIEELKKIEAIARQATGDLRLLLFRIHPQLLESKGLAAALQDLGQKTSQVHDKRVSIQVESQVLTRLDMDQQVSIFHLVERALREACKKEELENVRVRLASGSQGQAILEVEDDGLVVTASNRNPTGALAAGLESIQKPVDFLGGAVEFDVLGDHSSCLRITIPLEEKPADHTPGKA